MEPMHVIIKMFVCSFLPAPSQPTWDRDNERKKMMAKQANMAMIPVGPSAPPYGERDNWIPRTADVSPHKSTLKTRS
jgi:hypothetical protein